MASGKTKFAIRSELGVVGLLIATIMMMVVPLPTEAVDVLLACNLGMSVLLLMVAFYLQSPVELSTLPSIILLTTVFRLSLSIAVTRLVLTQADAGDIIRTFGDFVVSGNILVGLVIFLIITVVQFIVITKGAERIAEVAARFTLDAMPGKQMAIDADLRSGEIDQSIGRQRRQSLERESQFYGAMDGAMKFVKGDAVAGLVIIVINLVGGLIVGVMQHGQSFADAGETYSILTIGDGLVAQIPALIISITAGTVVTRVAGGEGDSLGGEIAIQLVGNSRALWLSAGIAALMGFIPGFPTVVFLVIAAGMALLARRARRVTVALAEAAKPRAAVPPPPARVQVHVSPALLAELTSDKLQNAVGRSFVTLAGQLGIPVPMAEIVHDGTLGERRFRADLDGVPMAEGEIPAHCLLLRDEAVHAQLAGVTVVPGRAMPGTSESLWVGQAQLPAVQAARLGVMEPADALAQSVCVVLRRQASQLVGIQEARQILTAAEQQFGELVRETQRVIPTQRAADLFRRLLDEGLSLRNLRSLLESLLEHAGREQESAALVETVRASMRRQICHTYADPLRVIGAFVIDGGAETMLRAALQQGAASGQLNVVTGAVAALVEQVRAETGASRGPGPVLMTAADIRRPVRALLANNGVFTPVLSFHDLLPDYTVQVLGNIRATGVEQVSADRQAA